MSVNNKESKISYEYTWVSYNFQKTAPINASFVESKQWFLVMFTYQSFFCTIMCYPFIFSRPRMISRYCPRTVISSLLH